ncbi:hypothetical protein PFISCL1PPCAC_7107, partial [Pristionchus fissidentatus]
RICALLSLFIAIGASFFCDDAGSQCATMYVGEICGHRRLSIKPNENIADLGDLEFDNVIQSVVVTRDCALLLYDQHLFKGNRRMLLGNLKDEQYYLLDSGMRGAASSARCKCNITTMEI